MHGIGRKSRLLSTGIEQNNDLTRIMCGIQFRGSFNAKIQSFHSS